MVSKMIYCNVYPKTFSSKSCLSKHKQIHKGVKKCTCQQCNKSFIWDADLKRHSLIHSGEKLYNCQPCNKSFSLNSMASISCLVKELFFYFIIIEAK